MNRSVIVGRLTRDVDLRYTPSGQAVGNFTIAVNRPFKNKQTDEYDADFINCVAWGRTAENLSQHMKKGSQIGVDGRIQTRTYEDNDGKTIYVTEIVADRVQFLESKQSNNQQAKNDPYDGYIKRQQQGQPLDIKEDDLPF